MKYLKKYTLYKRVSKETKIFESKKVLNNIEDIFREIEDIGFKIEYIRGGVDEILKIFIEKFDVYGFSDEPKHVTYMITQEIIDSLLHLVSYVKESNLDYRIDIMLNQSYRRSISILTESEIENMINWEEPIDYIKIVIRNKD